MVFHRGALLALVTAIVLSGCGTRGGPVPGTTGSVPTKPRPVTGPAGTDRSRSAESQGLGGGSGADDLDSATGPLSKRIIYFPYDSDEVLPEYQPIVTAHAEYLAAHGGQSAVLEGHADERGSSEYNIALAERRAKSVAKNLRLQGVEESQLRVLSYGEEKPAAEGHEETAWGQNRRVEIVYPGH